MQSEVMSLEEEPSSLISENTERSGVSGGVDHTSDPPESDPGSDAFNDSDCGEPLIFQRLVLDFTPTEEDTDFIQRKCCAFWEFVNKQPELEGLAAFTALELTDEVSESDDYDYASTRDQPKSTPQLNSIEKTAVSMLELVEEKGLIDRAFESRLLTSHCSLGLANYEDEELNDTAKGDHAEPARPPRLSIVGSPKTRSQLLRRPRDSAVASSPSVRDMCRVLRQWDQEHPKSMAPPGPAPHLATDVTPAPAPHLASDVTPAPAPKPPRAKQCSCKTVCRVKPGVH